MDLKPATEGRLIVTPNPVTCDGQRNIAAKLIPGETLSAFLARSVPEDMGHGWEVRINGVVVPHEVMSRVRPKDGTIIEVRSLVKKQALYIIAMVALIYFTGGLGAGAASTVGGAMFGTTAAGALTTAGMIANAVVFMAGSLLINKMLGPKPPKVESQTQDNVHSLGAARNQVRQYQPPGLLFGKMRIAPDIYSLPYPWHQGNDMYLGLVLTPGFNVGRVEALDNGDTPLAGYEGVLVYHKNFSGMPSVDIPLYANANTIQGGELEKPMGGLRWVTRTTPEKTVRVQINLEYMLGDQTSKGKPYTNSATVSVEYRAVGTAEWKPLTSRTFYNADFNPKRATIAADVASGQYDIRVSRSMAAQEAEGQNGRAQFQWTTMTAVQAQEGGYAGLPEIGVMMKATGQLNGTPDELRCVAVSKPCDVWTASGWVTQETSNPGAHMLRYARGIYDEEGTLVAGIGLDDEMIDIESFKGFMLHCAANNYTYDFWVRDPRSHDEMLGSLALVAMGQHTWAPGKLTVIWAAEDQPASGVVNMATIKKGQFQVDYTLANAADGIEYTYFDATRWDTGIVRVSAPDVATPLNPASVTGEGVTRAEHAAELARWHMAQSIYQYKDISYSTDLEHLSYRRLSVLQLQHDLTQWGYGGRLEAAVEVNGVTTLTLDEPVPAPTGGNAYIGVRVPGERNMRVFPVQSFTGESDTVTLTQPWPSDLPLPGEFEDDPAHDYVWVYDFKATPGLKVRVVGIQPEGDMKGAAVSVVPETPEFWNYIKTGAYEVPANQSLLLSAPVASNLVVTQVVDSDLIGEVIELQLDFDVRGPYGHAEIFVALTGGTLAKVGETTTNTARWKPNAAGSYRIEVRPFGLDGRAGTAATATVTVPEGGLLAPPPPPQNVVTTPVADGVLLEWAALFPGEKVIVEIYVNNNWTQVDEVVEGSQYMLSLPQGATDARVKRVKAGVESSPVDVGTVEPVLISEVRTEWLTQAAADATAKANAARAAADAALATAKVQIAADRTTAIAAEAAARTTAIAAEATNRATAITTAVGAEAAARGNAIAAAINTEIANRNTSIAAAQTTLTQERINADNALSQRIDNIATGSGEQFDYIKLWDFGSGVEGWGAPGGTLTQAAGYVRIPAGSNTYAQSPVALAVDAATYKQVKAKIKRTGSPAWEGRLRWRTTGQPLNFGVPAVVNQYHDVAVPVFDADGDAVIDFKDLPWAGTVDQIRLDLSPTSDASNYFQIDWIAVGRPTPGASIAALETVNQASIGRDAAEVTSRQTLASQITGFLDPTGKTLAQLTSGLLFDERTARTTADSAEVTARQALSTKLVGQPDPTGLTITGLSSGLLYDERVARSTADASEVTARQNLDARLTGFTDSSGKTLANLTTGLLFDERQARATADAAEVTARQTLSTKLVGNVDPSGVTLGNITSGLLHDEKQARSTADSAEVTARQGLSVTITGMSDPSGKTLAQLTSGLIYDERQARVTADSSQVSRISTMEARMPSGTGGLATSASVTDEATARAAADNALSTRTGVVEARMPTGTGELATKAATDAAASAAQTVDARVTTVESASVTRDNALASRADVVEARMPAGSGQLATASGLSALDVRVTATEAFGSRIGTIEARMPTGSDKLANEARVVAAETAAATANTATANRVTATESAINTKSFLGGTGQNLLPDEYSIFEAATLPAISVVNAGTLTRDAGVSYSGKGSLKFSATGSNAFFTLAPAGASNIPHEASRSYIVQFRVRCSLASVTSNIYFYGADGIARGGQTVTTPATANTWGLVSVVINVPDSGPYIRLRLDNDGGAGCDMWFDQIMVEPQIGTSTTPSPYTRGLTASAQVSTLARVIAEETARVNGDNALGSRTSTIEARMPTGSGELSTKAATDAAASAAQAASDLAGGKGKVIFGNTTPAAADRLPQNLWIDTNGNTNTPKRWNGTTWATVTDKAATDAAAAAAAALAHSQTVDARVTTVESASVTRDNALANRTNVIEARMPTGSDKLANEARVVAAENAAATANTAVADRTSALEATVAGKASASVVQEMRAYVAQGGNLIKNSTFEPGIEGWTGSPIRNLSAPNWKPHLVNTIGFAPGGVRDSSYIMDSFSPSAPCEAGAYYAVSAQLAARRCVAIVYVVFMDAAGNWLLTPYVGDNNGVAGGNTLSGWHRAQGVFQAPANTTQVALLFRLKGNGGSDPYAWMCQPQIAKVSPGTTTAPPYSPGGVEMHASATMFAKAGNSLVGYKIGTNGATSDFEFYADNFKLVTGGGTGLALDKTRMDRKFGNAAFYEGDPFGADSLVMWIGPASIAKSAATKANGTLWIAADGTSGGGSAIGGATSYFKEEAGQNNSITATTVQFPRNTAKAAREITATLWIATSGAAYSNNGSGSDSFGTAFVVEVSRDGGSWTQVGSIGQCVGTVTRDNSEPGVTFYNADGSGSMTVYDNTASGTNLQYRARETSPMPSLGTTAVPDRTISVKVVEI